MWLSIFSLFLPALSLSPSLMRFFWVCHTPFLTPFMTIFATRICCSFDLYESDFSILLVLSHSIFLSLSLPKSVISFFYFDNFFSLSLLLYPAIIYAFKLSSLPLATSLFLSLFIFFFSHLYVTIFFLYSLSVCFCLSNYLWFFVSLSLCAADLLLSLTPLTLSTKQ